MKFERKMKKMTERRKNWQSRKPDNTFLHSNTKPISQL